MEFTKREVACFGLGVAVGAAVVLAGEYAWKKVKEHKEDTSEEEKPQEDSKELEKEAAVYNVKLTPAETEHLAQEEEDGEEENEDEESDEEEATHWIDKNRNIVATYPKKNSPYIGVSTEEPDIYWVDEECYNLMLNKFGKGEISRKWTMESYFFLASTGCFYPDETEGPSPEKLSMEDEIKLRDRLQRYEDMVVSNFDGNEITIQSHGIKRWCDHLYFVDTRPDSMGVIMIKCENVDFSFEDYVDYCKEFVDDPADWYAQYGLEFGEVEDDVEP